MVLAPVLRTTNYLTLLSVTILDMVLWYRHIFYKYEHSPTAVLGPILDTGIGIGIQAQLVSLLCHHYVFYDYKLSIESRYRYQYLILNIRIEYQYRYLLILCIRRQRSDRVSSYWAFARWIVEVFPSGSSSWGVCVYVCWSRQTGSVRPAVFVEGRYSGKKHELLVLLFFPLHSGTI